MKTSIQIIKIDRLSLYFCMGLAIYGYTQSHLNNDSKPVWKVDYLDDFNSFNSDNWQDQMLWVNNEDQCYVPNNQFNTREVSNGTLKLRVIDLGEDRPCQNINKTDEKHPDTRYVAGRIASKNRKEFIKGKWTARLRVKDRGQAGMFPAWWLPGSK